MKKQLCFLAVVMAFTTFRISLAQEADAAPLSQAEKQAEPENAVGVAGPDGKLDYGSPNLPQELHNKLAFKIKYASTDEDYGRTVEKPIMVGNDGGGRNGPLNEQRFLNALAGPNGEKVAYRRRGSGHPFATDNGVMKGMGGMLDIYEVTYEGLREPIVLYINMYDSDTLKVPVGFSNRYPQKERSE